MDEIIKIKDLSVFYEDKCVLDKINVGIRRNRITSIIGHSGSGKSTLLTAINNLISLDENARVEGEILLNDKIISNLPEGELRRRVGMVFQAPSPFPFSIRKNLTYAPTFYGIKDKETLMNITVQSLKIVGLYDEVKNDLNKNARKLSGGQQQRLCIARALTADPEVLLLDEPCSALDFENTKLIEGLLLQLKQKYTIVIVTHDLFEAKRLADDCIFLSNGKIIECGEFKNMLKSPKEQATRDYLRDILE